MAQNKAKSEAPTTCSKKNKKNKAPTTRHEGERESQRGIGVVSTRIYYMDPISRKGYVGPTSHRPKRLY
jgi:hypothetical protein